VFEESEVIDTFMDDWELSDSQTEFLYLRWSIKSLILEIVRGLTKDQVVISKEKKKFEDMLGDLTLRERNPEKVRYIDSLNWVINEILTVFTSILSEKEHISKEELNLQLEATLGILHYYLQWVKGVHKILVEEIELDELKTLFFIEEYQYLFTGEHTHPLVTEKYLEWVWIFWDFFLDFHTRMFLWKNLLSFYKREDIFMNWNASLITLYASSFSNFIKANLAEIPKSDLDYI
jgi:hypothetical protein